MNEWEWNLLENHPRFDSLAHDGGELRPGTRVRLRPRTHGGDALDLFLAGKTAVIESIEQNYEGELHLAVVVDDDPGRDLGLMRQPGHRFFYTPNEVERLREDEIPQASTAVPNESLAEAPILIAGIGNIFLGDDGFGVAVAQRLLKGELPEGVRVVDFGIRSLDLAYALMDSSGVVIVIDACSRGAEPATLYVIEPHTDAFSKDTGPALEAHSMDPMVVLRMADAMGARSANRILLLGCEPATLGPDEGQLGLSDRVAAVVGDAADLALMLVQRIRDGNWPAEGGSVPPERSTSDNGSP
jgi:hydrogenase maturation protease